MKTGKLVKNRHNRDVFIYDNKTYKYDDIYNLIKTLHYTKSGKDCDWTIIRVHDILSDKDCFNTPNSVEFMSTKLLFDGKQYIPSSFLYESSIRISLKNTGE